MNTATDNYIDTLKEGSEVQYNGTIHIIQSCTQCDVEILEKWEINQEEKMTVTWWEIAEEYELLGLWEQK
jgi:hypothetical protein